MLLPAGRNSSFETRSAQQNNTVVSSVPVCIMQYIEWSTIYNATYLVPSIFIAPFYIVFCRRLLVTWLHFFFILAHYYVLV